MDDNGKSNSSDSDDSSADDADGTNRNHPAILRQATGKGKLNLEERNKNEPVGRLGRL